jgi:hypothetical protein
MAMVPCRCPQVTGHGNKFGREKAKAIGALLRSWRAAVPPCRLPASGDEYAKPARQLHTRPKATKLRRSAGGFSQHAVASFPLAFVRFRLPAAAPYPAGQDLRRGAWAMVGASDY